MYINRVSDVYNINVSRATIAAANRYMHNTQIYMMVISVLTKYINDNVL